MLHRLTFIVRGAFRVKMALCLQAVESTSSDSFCDSPAGMEESLCFRRNTVAKAEMAGVALAAVQYGITQD